MIEQKPKDKMLWLIYLALILSGALLIADALGVDVLSKITTRLGAGLIFTALALLVGKDRPAGIIGIAIVWVAIIITFFN